MAILHKGNPFVFLVAWLLLGMAETSFETHYDQALQAMDRQDWEAAVELLEKAVEANPTAGGKVSVSRGKELYLPHYQLGLALYRADRLREASEAWRQSAIQGVLAKKRKKLQKEVDAYLLEIDTRLIETSKAPVPEPAAEPIVRSLSPEELAVARRAAKRQLDRAARKLSRLDGERYRDVLEESPDLQQDRDRGSEMLDRARAMLEKAADDAVALQEAHSVGAEAAQILEKAALLAARRVREEGSPSDSGSGEG